MKIRPLVYSALMVLSGSFSLCSVAAESKSFSRDDLQEEERHSNPALDVNDLTATIRTSGDLDRYLSTASETPLDKLPAAARASFIRSLVFTGTGLGSYSYVELRRYLGAADIYRVLALFGVQHSLSVIEGVRLNNDLDREVAELAADKVHETARSYPSRVRSDYICDSGNGPEHCRYSFGNVCGDRCGKTR